MQDNKCEERAQLNEVNEVVEEYQVEVEEGEINENAINVMIENHAEVIQQEGKDKIEETNDDINVMHMITSMQIPLQGAKNKKVDESGSLIPDAPMAGKLFGELYQDILTYDHQASNSNAMSQQNFIFYGKNRPEVTPGNNLPKNPNYTPKSQIKENTHTKFNQQTNYYPTFHQPPGFKGHSVQPIKDAPLALPTNKYKETPASSKWIQTTKKMKERNPKSIIKEPRT